MKIMRCGKSSQKALTSSDRRELVETLVDEYDLPVKRACLAVRMSRSAWYREPQSATEDEEIRAALNELVDRWPRWGFCKCFWLAKGERQVLESQACTTHLLFDEA
jgi:hypothetical protein